MQSDNRTSASVDCRRPAVLIRRETALEGWSAKIDGRPARIDRASGLFQAVVVPPGSHHVTFSYAPPGIGWALVGLLGGCLLLCTPAAAGGIARLRQPAPEREPPSVVSA